MYSKEQKQEINYRRYKSISGSSTVHTNLNIKLNKINYSKDKISANALVSFKRPAYYGINAKEK